MNVVEFEMATPPARSAPAPDRLPEAAPAEPFDRVLARQAAETRADSHAPSPAADSRVPRDDAAPGADTRAEPAAGRADGAHSTGKKGETRKDADDAGPAADADAKKAKAVAVGPGADGGPAAAKATASVEGTDPAGTPPTPPVTATPATAAEGAPAAPAPPVPAPTAAAATAGATLGAAGGKAAPDGADGGQEAGKDGGKDGDTGARRAAARHGADAKAALPAPAPPASDPAAAATALARAMQQAAPAAQAALARAAEAATGSGHDPQPHDGGPDRGDALQATPGTGDPAPRVAADLRAMRADAARHAPAFDQVMDHTLHMVRMGRHEASLRLVPDHLGEVRVRVSVDRGHVVADLTCHTPQARDLLEGHQARLQQALMDGGADGARVNVSLGGDQGRQGPQENPAPRDADPVTAPATAASVAEVRGAGPAAAGMLSIRA
jgi:flagellar hook-length control protein FliK